MSRNQWIVIAVLILAASCGLGGIAGYLLTSPTAGFPAQPSGPAQPTGTATQPPVDTATTVPTSTPTSAPPTAVPEPPTPTNTMVVPLTTPLAGPTIISVETVAPDDWEPDNSLADATLIEVGQTQSHNLHVKGDHDWVCFETEEGGTYVVKTSNLGGGIDTTIYLYDGAENELLSDDDGGDEFWASRFQWTATEGGRLYVMIRDLGDNDAGPRTSYDVSLSLGEAFEIDEYEPDDARPGANRIEVGETQTHNLHIAGDHDWVYFEAVAGTTYIIETSSLGSEVDTMIYLYDESWNELASDDDKGGEFLASRLEWTATENGTLYVRIEDWGGAAAGPGTQYDISVSER